MARSRPAPKPAAKAFTKANANAAFNRGPAKPALNTRPLLGSGSRTPQPVARPMNVDMSRMPTSSTSKKPPLNTSSLRKGKR